MKIRMIALAIPAALGIACTHSSHAAKDHTGAMWAQREKDAQAAMEQESLVAVDGTSNLTVAKLQATGSQGDSMSGSTPDTSGSSAGSQGQGSMSGSGSSMSGSGSSGSSDSGSTMGQSDSSGGAPGQSDSSSGQAGMGKSSESAGDSSSGMASTKSSKKGGHRVFGKISDVSSDSITIAPKKGEAKTLKISSDTKITMNGKSAKPTDLKQGTPVRASYSSSDGEDTATQISAGKNGQRPRGSKKGAAGSSGASGGTGMSGGMNK